MKKIKVTLSFGKFLQLESKVIEGEKDIYVVMQTVAYYNRMLGQLVGVLLKVEEV